MSYPQGQQGGYPQQPMQQQQQQPPRGYPQQPMQQQQQQPPRGYPNAQQQPPRQAPPQYHQQQAPPPPQQQQQRPMPQQAAGITHQMGGMNLGNRPPTTSAPPGGAMAPRGTFSPQRTPNGQPPRPGMPSPQQQPPRPGMQPPKPSMPTPQQQPPRPGMQPPRPGMPSPQQQQPPRPGMPSPQQQPPRPGMPSPQQQPQRPGMQQQPPRPNMPPQQHMQQQPPRPGMPPQQHMQQQQQQQQPPRSGMPPQNHMQQQPPRPGMPPMQQAPPRPGMMPKQMQQAPPPRPGMGGQPGMGQPGMMPAAQPAGGYPGAGAPQQPQIVADPAAQCPAHLMQPTFGSFPATQALSKQSALPLGVVIQPLADDPTGKETPVVNYGSIGVVRCRSCRAYMNPFVIWTDNGRRWRCNLCNRDNETGSQYYSHLDGNGHRADRMERPELHSGCVEIVAPQEYMIRPPQAPVFVFVLDVSYEAVASGMLYCAVETIKANLDKLPGAPRTQVALLTFDYAVHFYSLNPTLTQPKMFVVSDLEELFLPCPEDLLVNLTDSRESFEMLLNSLPSIHGKNATHDIAAGSAIQAAYRVMVHIGGKMMVFQTKLPTLGLGKLAPRENPRLLGTDKEHTLFEAQGAFYKNNVSEMCKNQVAIDLFLFPNAFSDVASLANLPKFTGGQLHFYPRFNAQTQGEALAADIARTLQRETAWEAVFRLRASTGVRVSGFFGNFQLRAGDLLQLPNCDADATYGLEFSFKDSVVSTGHVTLQGALLYTNSNGQRRIRVLTSVFPVTSNLTELHGTANQEAICGLIAKKATHDAIATGLSDVRSKIMNFCVNVMRASRNLSPMGHGVVPGQQQQMQSQGLAPSLQLLPLYTMAMQKNLAFRGGNDVPVDDRIAALQTFARMSLGHCILSIHPRLFVIDAMSPDMGRLVAVPEGQPAAAEGMLPAGDNQRLRLPNTVNLSAGALRSNGVFLLNNGHQLYMWLGRAADQGLVQTLFGVPTLDGIDAGVLRIERQPGDPDFKQRVCNVIDALRAEHPGTFQPLHFVKEGDAFEARFRVNLVEDRAPFNGGSFSYEEYFAHCQRLSTSVSR